MVRSKNKQDEVISWLFHQFFSHIHISFYAYSYITCIYIHANVLLCTYITLNFFLCRTIIDSSHSDNSFCSNDDLESPPLGISSIVAWKPNFPWKCCLKLKKDLDNCLLFCYQRTFVFFKRCIFSYLRFASKYYYEMQWQLRTLLNSQQWTLYGNRSSFFVQVESFAIRCGIRNFDWISQ